MITGMISDSFENMISFELKMSILHTHNWRSPKYIETFNDKLQELMIERGEE